MLYQNNLEKSREKLAKELIETYLKNPIESFLIYKDAVVGVGPAKEFVAYVEELHKNTTGKTLTDYLKEENKGNAQDWIFGFLVGAATQRFLDSKEQPIKEKV